MFLFYSDLNQELTLLNSSELFTILKYLMTLPERRCCKFNSGTMRSRLEKSICSLNESVLKSIIKIIKKDTTVKSRPLLRMEQQ